MIDASFFSFTQEYKPLGNNAFTLKLPSSCYSYSFFNFSSQSKCFHIWIVLCHQERNEKNYTNLAWRTFLSTSHTIRRRTACDLDRSRSIGENPSRWRRGRRVGNGLSMFRRRSISISRWLFLFSGQFGEVSKKLTKKSQSEGILESPVGLLGTRQGTWLMFWVWLIPVVVDLCGFRGKVFGSFKKFKLCLNLKCFAHQSNRNNEIDPLSDHLSSINLIFHSPNRHLFTTDKKKHPF